MVQVLYRGQNYVLINGYKIINGANEIKDDDFWRMMKSPTFAFRVKEKIFEIPKDFPLEKPSVNLESKKVSSEEKVERKKSEIEKTDLKSDKK